MQQHIEFVRSSSRTIGPLLVIFERLILVTWDSDDFDGRVNQRNVVEKVLEVSAKIVVTNLTAGEYNGLLSSPVREGEIHEFRPQLKGCVRLVELSGTGEPYADCHPLSYSLAPSRRMEYSATFENIGSLLRTGENGQDEVLVP